MKAFKFLKDVRELLKQSSRFPTLKLFMQALMCFGVVMYGFFFLDVNTVMLFAFVLIPNLITRSFLKLYRVDDKMVEDMPAEERLMTTDNFFLVLQVCFVLAAPSIILCLMKNFYSTLIGIGTYMVLGYRLLSLAKTVFKSDTPYWRDAFIFTRILISVLGLLTFLIYVIFLTSIGNQIFDFIKLDQLTEIKEQYKYLGFVIYTLSIIILYFSLPLIIYYLLKKAKVYDRQKHLEQIENEKKTEEEEKIFRLNEISKEKLLKIIQEIYIDKIAKKSEYYIEKFHEKHTGSEKINDFLNFVKNNYSEDYKLLYADEAKREFFVEP
jgi:hypothetical protein